MAKTKIDKIDIKSIDLNKLDLEVNIDEVSFEDAVEVAERLSSDIHSGRLDVASTQKAYIFANRLLEHARSTLDKFSLTLEVIGESRNELREIILNGAMSLFTGVTECVKREDLGGVRLLLERFMEQVVDSCDKMICKDKS